MHNAYVINKIKLIYNDIKKVFSKHVTFNIITNTNVTSMDQVRHIGSNISRLIGPDVRHNNIHKRLLKSVSSQRVKFTYNTNSRVNNVTNFLHIISRCVHTLIFGGHLRDLRVHQY